MKTKIITLKDEPLAAKRRERFRGEAEKVGMEDYKFFPATHHEDVNIFGNVAHTDGFMLPIDTGSLACWRDHLECGAAIAMSHMRAWIEFLHETDHEWLIVFEDDAVPLANEEDIVKRCKEFDNAHMVLLQGHLECNRHHFVTSNCCGLFGYAINRHGIGLALNHLVPLRKRLDWQLFAAFRGNAGPIRAFKAKTPMVEHRPMGHSFNQQ